MSLEQPRHGTIVVSLDGSWGIGFHLWLLVAGRDDDATWLRLVVDLLRSDVGELASRIARRELAPWIHSSVVGDLGLRVENFLARARRHRVVLRPRDRVVVAADAHPAQLLDAVVRGALNHLDHLFDPEGVGIVGVQDFSGGFGDLGCGRKIDSLPGGDVALEEPGFAWGVRHMSFCGPCWLRFVNSFAG